MIIRHKVSRSFSTSLCTKRATEKNNYSNTVLLPKTKLPLRLEGQKLINRDNLLSSVSLLNYAKITFIKTKILEFPVY